MATRLILIAVGGALGSLARYGVSVLAISLWGDGFPLGTLLVNAVGCFAMGILTVYAQALAISSEFNLLAATGFLGGFTTYSAFCGQTLIYIQQGQWEPALRYTALTLIICLAASAVGFSLAQRLR